MQSVQEGGRMNMMIIPLFVLGADSVCDLKRREIFPALTIVCTAAGAAAALTVRNVSLFWLLAAFTPGAVVMALSILTGGKIGQGDAFALFAVGAWTDFWTAWETILLAVFAVSVFSGIWWFVKRKNAEIPFVPFLLAAFGVLSALQR